MYDTLLFDMSGNESSSVILKNCGVPLLWKYLFPLGVQCLNLDKRAVSFQMLTFLSVELEVSHIVYWDKALCPTGNRL